MYLTSELSLYPFELKHPAVHSFLVTSSPQRLHSHRRLAFCTAVTRQRTHEMVCTNFPCASLWMSSMSWRFGSRLIISSPDLDAVTLTKDCGFGWTSLRFVIARLSTKTDEHASKVQYTFLDRENFLTNLRNWTMAPKKGKQVMTKAISLSLSSVPALVKKKKEKKLNGRNIKAAKILATEER